MSARQGDGATLRTHLQRHARNTGQIDPLLLTEWPREGRMVWWAFNTMGRQYGMAGPLPITATEIDAWQRVHGIRLTPWELSMIRVFDQIALEAAAQKDSA